MRNLFPTHADVGVDELAARSGRVFARFLLEDSGCRAYGVEVDRTRWFVKGAVEERAVPSLERAVVLHSVVAHPTLIPLRHHVATPLGPVLVYPWVDGEVLYAGGSHGRHARQALDSAHARFRSLAFSDVVDAFDCILDAHLDLAAAGFVAVDLYDGCFIYDFDAHQMWVCDLDEYRLGSFVLDDDRLPGSTRFMAPEEWKRGAVIDERTMVFNLGRVALVLLDEREVGEAFRGTHAMAAVLARATRSDPADRYFTVRELASAWRRVSR
jgi:hypothetical protein